MKREAFGKIGLLPHEFYRMLYADYIIKQQGFTEKIREDRRVIRLAVKRLLEPHMEKGKRIQEWDVWWMDGDDELKEEMKEARTSSASRSLDRLKAMKRLEAWKKREQGQKPKSN